MSSSEPFDIAIVGGGIAGLGLALFASQAGKRVVLLEKEACGLGVSNNSLRIIHGGLRYLQKFDFPRVVNSLLDQTYCLKKWPKLVRPLRCVAPLTGHGLKRASFARMASVLYACFLGACRSPLDRPYVDRRKLLVDVPDLSTLAEHGYLIWQDALLLNPRELVFCMLEESRKHGALVLEQHTVTDYVEDHIGVRIFVDRNIDLRSKFLVNCSGAPLGQRASPFAEKWCLGFNVILKKQFAESCAFGSDGPQGRYFFFVPRQDQTVLGTAYVPIETSQKNDAPNSKVIEEFVREAAVAAPSLNLSVADIVETEYGALPMRGLARNGQPELFGSSLVKREGKVVQLLSTKYTTFRSQALEVLKLLDG